MIALRGGVPDASKIECVAACRDVHSIKTAYWPTISAVGILFLVALAIVRPPAALAVPSYARQTGQTCATCHTAFPELTPYGRQFKLAGYTAGGTRCGDGSDETDRTQIPLSVMAWPATFTHVASNLALPDNNNQWAAGQFSLFVAGQLYCDVGAFAQMTYSRPGNSFTWDNTDIRYAKTGVIDGTSIVYGITANNNPTVQDVWNTIPAWSFPFITSQVAPTPAVAPLIQGGWAAQVGGIGGYVWINNSIYAEFTAYGDLPPRLLTDFAGSAAVANRFADSAPYWRLAYENTWGNNSLMFGTFGMFADVQPTGGTPVPLVSGVTDPTLDVGIDSQYQWIGLEHIFSVRGSYIWENKKNNVELVAPGGPFASNPRDQLNTVNISTTYIYDRAYSFTAGYFNTWGTTDVLLYGSLATGSGFIASSANGSPNSSGWNFDLAYLPFSRGGPDLWPWFNARIGVLYTHYDKFDGSTNNVDQIIGLKASGNDTVFIYTWLMF
jgi:hypothetical protein